MRAIPLLAFCGCSVLIACGTTTGGGAAVEDAVVGWDAALTDAGVDVAGTDAIAGTDAVLIDSADAAATDAIAPADVADAAVDVAQDTGKPDVVTPQGCGGKTSVACATNEYCAVPDGQCGGIGVCTVKPQICPDIAAPVCGCNGTTYANSCEAAAHGITVSSTGACVVDNTCGGFIGKPCAMGQFCDPNGCGADQMGVCVTLTTGCPKNLAWVCGCDGKNYENDCYRQNAGVGKASDGQCPPLTGGCNVGDNTTCGKSQFCKGNVDIGCSGDGTCAPIPMVCPMLFKPVCGCDNNTYGNSCEANAAGVNVSADGECGTPGCVTTKDCTGGLACKAGICGSCPGIMCTALACPPGQVKDQCCTCYTP